MNPAVTGALAGLALAVAIFVFDYMMTRRNIAERSARTKRKAEMDANERKALVSLARFLVLLPPAGALLFWALS